MNEWARAERGRRTNGCGRNSSFITPFSSRTCAVSRCPHELRTALASFHPPADKHTRLKARLTYFGTIFHHETLSSSSLNWVSIGFRLLPKSRTLRKCEFCGKISRSRGIGPKLPALACVRVREQQFVGIRVPFPSAPILAIYGRGGQRIKSATR